MKYVAIILLCVFAAGCANDGSGYASWTARDTGSVAANKKLWDQGGSGARGEAERSSVY